MYSVLYSIHAQVCPPIGPIDVFYWINFQFPDIAALLQQRGERSPGLLQALTGFNSSQFTCYLGERSPRLPWASLEMSE